MLREESGEPLYFDCLLKIRVQADKISTAARERLEETAERIQHGSGEYLSYSLRFGRFEHTIIDGLGPVEADDGTKGIFYLTEKGNLSFLVNAEPKPYVRLQIDRYKARPGQIEIEGKLFSRNSRIMSGHAFIRGRESKKEFRADAVFIPDEQGIRSKYGLNRYTYRIYMDLGQVCDPAVPDDVYDFYFSLNLHDQTEAVLKRIGRPTGRVRLFYKDNYAQRGDNAAVIHPYFTFKASNLSLEITQFPLETFQYMKKKMNLSFFKNLFSRKKDVWIIGERLYKAQDTGYHLFRYMRTHHPDQEVYYVIDERSPEKANVGKFGNVLHYKSKEHIDKTLQASRILSSHHPDYLYPVRTKQFKRKVKALRVFLQHGVMGTKNMVANYGKHAPSGFETDLFLVSSEFEKEMIIHDFGYKEGEVKVTGLSRFDSLLADDTAVKRQLLIIPTWRDWITSDEVFLESDYFQRYKDLIHHPYLHELARRHHLEIIFCLHPNMQKFTSYFQDAPVRVISQGETDVQTLLKESVMMVTDYSSVAFDFSFLHKPVIYYQFDRMRFIGRRPSHLDLDQDLPGDIVFDLPELLGAMEAVMAGGFHMRKEMRARADKFLAFRDTRSSERIYQTVSEAEKPARPVTEWFGQEAGGMLFRRFRRSSYYFPAMKLAYRLMKTLLPVDEKLILFESGVGKQYGDSPRYIYEELVRRGSSYKKVWVYNGKMHVKDRNTIKIKRLSPQYYYYLARAGYWVNNQNFPSYLKKRKGTTYIQTWHGTPLKKMLFDIDKIMGRDEGYVQRVHQATRNWDYLLSPSPYATKAFRSAFRYEGEVLEAGYPRNDLFFRDDAMEQAGMIKQRLGIPSEKKVILYAPTFRDSQSGQANRFSFRLEMDLEDMQRRLGDEYVLLLRMHVVVSEKLDIPVQCRGFAKDVSRFPDIQELFLISDILITDYSSVMFDFVHTSRPILFFTYDLEDYRDHMRGFYLDFEREAPGPFCRETEDLAEAIVRIDDIEEEYRDKYEAFKDRYCGKEDGMAAKRVVDRIFSSV